MPACPGAQIGATEEVTRKMPKTAPAKPDVDVPLADLVAVYRLMVLIRRFEESTYRKYREGKIGGYLHRYDGEEALVAGILPLLKLPGDYVLCTYRDHAHALACGTPPGQVMAELLGKATGCAGGKGGSMHLIDPDRGFLGGDGIVGGPVPVATGVGYAQKYRATGNVCVCYFGDGAINQGGVHEALNMAGLYKVPVLYVLENNKYAMGTSVERSTGQPDMCQKARAHGVEAARVDGMDVLAVRKIAGEAIERMRKDPQPFFLEVDCYRFAGHGVADNAQMQSAYRTQDEVESWKKRDPIALLTAYLREQGALDDAAERAIEAEVQAEVEAAIQFAEASPDPPLDSLYENVFA